MSRSAILLSAGLILSLGFNLWLLADQADQHGQPSVPVRREALTNCPKPRVIAAPVRERATCAQCETDLSACRTQSWRLAADLIAKDAKRATKPEAAAAKTQRMMCKIAVEHLDDPLVDKPSDLGLRMERLKALDFEQRQMRRCEIAQEILHKHWAGMQQDIERILLSFEAPKVQEEWYGDKARDIASTLALNERERADLAHEYRAAMQPHMTAFERLIAKRPLDYAAVVERIEAHLQAEDALVRRLYGEDALAHFRFAQAQGRASLLAMLGQYAER